MTWCFFLDSTWRGRFSVAQIVDNHFGRAKDFVAAAVTTLEGLKHDMVGFRRVGTHGDSLVVMGVKWPPEALLGFDAMATKELVELLQGHLHALAELFGRGRHIAAERAFEVVDDWQQFADKGFLLGGRAALDFLGGSPAEVVEVGGQAQVAVLLGNHLALQHSDIGRSGGIRSGVAGKTFFGRCGIRIRVHTRPKIGVFRIRRDELQVRPGNFL
jgi:hypothetical protein